MSSHWSQKSILLVVKQEHQQKMLLYCKFLFPADFIEMVKRIAGILSPRVNMGCWRELYEEALAKIRVTHLHASSLEFCIHGHSISEAGDHRALASHIP